MNKIPLDQTNLFSSLILDYQKENQVLKGLYSFPQKTESFSEIIDKRSINSVDRKTLHKVLLRQFNDCEVKPLSSKANIDLLLNENTYTVCTGHQLCLLTGPLYVIYKIVTTINLSIKLKQQFPDKNFVPVLWMASEDHDFKEVNHIHLFGKRITWDDDKENNRGAVGEISLSGIEKFVDEVNTVLGDSKNADRVKLLISNSFKHSKNLSQAFRYLVASLFSEYGLVILDANEKELKTLFTSVVTKDVFSREAVELIGKANEVLKKHNYPTQINARPINLFYIQPGSRNRIEYLNGKFKILNTSLEFTESELASEIKEYPERFSPNVVLRPLYQESILPNLAYVGGPGEVAYWLQLKPLFDQHNISYPMVVLRNSALLIDKESIGKIEKLKLSIADFFNDLDVVVNKFISTTENSNYSVQQYSDSISAIYKKLAEDIEGIDPTLKNTAEAEMQKVLNGLNAIEAKAKRAIKTKHEVSIGQIKKIKDKFFPNGDPQERFDNFLPYYLKKGEELILVLMNELEPLQFDFKIIEL